jgi:hypothetical protein
MHRGRASLLLSEYSLRWFWGVEILTDGACRVDMKAILAEAEEMQASGRRQHAAASSLTSVHRQRSGDGMHVSFSLPRASDVPHSSSPGISRTASTPTRRGHSLSAESSSSSPGRVVNAQTLARTPPGAGQVSEKTSPAQSLSASTMQKSWSTQSSPGPSTSTRPGQPGLGPVINPPKAKAGLTATRHAPYVLFIPQTTNRTQF